MLLHVASSICRARSILTSASERMEREIVVLSSSPIRPDPFPSNMCAASYYDSQSCALVNSVASDVPDSEVETFATQRKAIPSGSRASAIPIDAVKGFRTASLISRTMEVADMTTSKKSSVSRSSTTKGRRRSCEATSSESAKPKESEGLGFKTTKPSVTKTVGCLTEESDTSKSQKTTRSENTADATKALSNEAIESSKGTGIEASSFAVDLKVSSANTTSEVTLDLTKQGSSPTARKRGWTPQADTACAVTAEDDGQDASNLAPSLDLSGFQYDQALTGNVTKTIHTGVQTLTTSAVDKSAVIPQTSGIRAKSKKSPQKKIQTVTEHALAKFYTAEDANDNEHLQVRSESMKEAAEPAHCIADGLEQPAKKARKTRTTGTAKAKKLKKPEPLRQKLVSPRSVSGRLTAQKMLFGTSSQLVLPASPESTSSRQKDSLESHSANTLATVEGPASRFRFATASTKRNVGIWDAQCSSSAQQSWQNEQNKEQEQKTSYDAANRAGIAMAQESDASANFSLRETTFDVSYEASDHATLATTQRTKANETKTKEARVDRSAIDEWKDIDDYSFTEPSKVVTSMPITVIEQVSAPSPGLSNLMVESHVLPATAALRAQLGAQEKRGRGRPSKATSKSPAKRKKRARSSSKSKKINAAKASVPRGGKKVTKTITPKKRTATSDGFVAIDDIMDDEANITPSPPRLRTDLTNELPLTTNPLPRSKRSGTRDDWDDIKAGLYARISKFVLDCPPTNDLRNPSWYERILMYQPVILEDFTTWLNEGGIKVKGVKEGDAEKQLSPWMVGKWCDEKSVCWMWRLTHKNVLRSER